MPPSSASTATPAVHGVNRGKRSLRAPGWLQAAVIILLLVGAVLVALDGRYLLCALLSVGGAAFGLSFLLRRMVGDEYGRT